MSGERSEYKITVLVYNIVLNVNGQLILDTAFNYGYLR